MSEIDVARTVQKIISVGKIKKPAKMDKKKQPLAKSKKPEVDEFQKRSHLYQEIFSQSNDVLKKALAKNSDWLIPFLQDALFCCSSGEASSFITRLDKAFECKFSPSESTVKELVKLLPTLVESVIESINSSTEAGIMGIRIWAFVIKILSQEIVTSHEITNSVCSVFAQGFKSSKTPIVRQSFTSWCSIIEAFAVDSSWSGLNRSSNEKRLELVLRALRHKVTPDASLQIFDTWWFLAKSLGERLPAVFDKVMHGLLRFCVGGETEYILPGVGESQIVERLAKTVSVDSKLVSLMNDGLNAIKYSKAVLNVAPELVSKLHLLIDAILKEEGSFSHAFSQKVLVKSHSILLTQCVRWISCNTSLESDIALNLPNLWLSISNKVNRVLRGEDRRRESKFYLVQLRSWVCENKHGGNLTSQTINLLQSANAFADFQREYQELVDLLPRSVENEPLCSEISESSVVLPIPSTQ